MSIYTILGEQTVLCEKKLRDILSQHQIGTDDVSVYDMKETSIQNALFDVQTVPFLSSKKAIVVKQPEFLTGRESKNEVNHDLNVFINFLEHPVTDNVLIIYAPYEKLDERKKIVKLLKQTSEMITFETYSQQSLKQWVEKKMREKNIAFDNRAVDLLLKLTQTKMDVLYQEMEKIDLYFLEEASPTLTMDVVEVLIARQLEDNVFLLTDALAQQKVADAYKIYQDLLTQNEEPFKIMILIANQFRLMKQVIQLSKQGYREADMGKMIGVHPYRVKLMNQQAYRFNLEVIEDYLYQIAQMDYKIKSGELQKELAIELLILNLKTR